MDKPQARKPKGDAVREQRNTELDPQEFDLPETTFSRDVENRVFQGIILKILSQISGIGLLEGTFLANLLGRVDKVKGITIEQDAQTHSVRIKIEVSIQYGVNIPHKAEEIQSAVVNEITSMTGLRVAEIHVVFKELMQEEPEGSEASLPHIPIDVPSSFTNDFENEF
jgi:uncharacterized alkaline shock family protein YloU